MRMARVEVAAMTRNAVSSVNGAFKDRYQMRIACPR